jgi:hypothetical protein
MLISTTVIAVAMKNEYWQDLLLRPDQQWIEKYGYNPDDVLAFNVHQLLLIVNNQGLAIQELERRLGVQDPNAVSDPNN